MKFLIPLVHYVLLPITLGLNACSSGDNNNALPKYRSVQGAVVKAPVSGASIEISAINRAGQALSPAITTVISDANGGFNIPNLPQGAYLARSRGGRFTDESDPSGQRVVDLTAEQGFETLIPIGATTATLNPFTQLLVDKLRTQAAQDDVPFNSLIEGGREVFEAAFGFDVLTTIPDNPIAPQPGAQVPLETAETNYAMALGGFAQAVNAIAVSLSASQPRFDIIRQYIRDLSDGVEDGNGKIALNINGVPLPIARLNQEINRFRNNNDTAYRNIPPFVIQLFRLTERAARDPSIVDPTPSPTVSATAPVATASPLPTPTPVATASSSPTPTPPVATASSSPTPTPSVATASSSPTPTPQATVSAPPQVAPIAQNSSATSNENQNANGQLLASDGNGDALSFAVAAQPSNGSVNVVSGTGSFTYTPNKYFSGSDSFSFTASDNSATSNTATVSITVLNTIDPFHLIEFGTGYSNDNEFAGASFVNSALVTVAELSAANNMLSLSDDGAITAEDRLLVDDALFTSDGLNYFSIFFDELSPNVSKSKSIQSKQLRSRSTDEDAFGTLSMRAPFNEGVDGSSAFSDFPSTQRFFPGSTGHYSGSDFFQTEDYHSLNSALYSNFKRPNVSRAEGVLDILIPFGTQADNTALNGSYGLVTFEVIFNTDGSGQSHLKTNAIGLPLLANVADKTATIASSKHIRRTPSNSNTSNPISDMLATTPGPDGNGQYRFIVAANGGLQLDFDSNGNDVIDSAVGEVAAYGAIDPQQKFFAAAFANGDNAASHKVGIVAGVKRYSGTVAASSLQNKQFVVHGIENQFEKNALDSRSSHIRHARLVFSADGTSADFQSSDRDSGSSSRFDDTDNFHVELFSGLDFSDSGGTVSHGMDGNITVDFSGSSGRMLQGFISDDLKSLVLTSHVDNTQSLHAGLLIGSSDNGCQDTSDCNLDNFPPSLAMEFSEGFEPKSGTAQINKDSKFASTMRNFGHETNSTPMLSNAESINVDVRFDEIDSGRGSLDEAPIAVRWTSTAGSFGVVVNQQDGSPYRTLSSTTWTAPSSGSGRTYLNAVASDGDFETVYRTEIAWGDSDGDGLVDDEESQFFSTDNTKADTDGDNLSDGYEVIIFGSNPIKVDTDEDDVADGFEDRYNTSPRDKDLVIHVDQSLSGGCFTSGSALTWASAFCGQTEVEAVLDGRTSADAPLYILYNAGEYRGLAINSSQNVYAIGSVGPSDSMPRSIDTAFKGSFGVIIKAAGCPEGAGNCAVITISNSFSVGLSNIRIFNGNNPGATGGGLKVTNSSTVQLDSLSIDSNTASYGGGIAIDNSSGDIYLRDSGVFNNTAVADSIAGTAGRGGGVYSLGGNLVIQKSKITSNHATTENSLGGDLNARGGGVFLQHSGFGIGLDSARIEQSYIEYNTVQGNGAGIYVDTQGPSCVTIIENQIRGNRTEFAANSEASGGGLWWGSESDCSSSFTPNAGTIFANEISANNAVDSGNLQGGGGIHASAGTKILHNIIVGNMTSGQGGGVLLSSAAAGSGPQQLFNNLVASNYALGNGGGVAFLDQRDERMNAHTLDSNSIVANATGGVASLGAGLFINAVDNLASRADFEMLSLSDNLITFNTEASGSNITDNVECRFDDENSPSSSSDCSNATACAGCEVVGSMLNNAFGDNANEVPAATSSSMNQLNMGGEQIADPHPFLVGGFRLDQNNSPLIDAASGAVADCAVDLDCSTHVSGAADTGLRDIGMHFKKPAAQPVTSIELDSGPFGATGINASDCAFVGFNTLQADNSSAGPEHIVSVQVDGSSATVSSSPSPATLFIKNDYVATAPPEAPAGSVLAQNLGNGEYSVYVCISSCGSSETLFDNVLLTVQADERPALTSEAISVNLAGPACSR